MTATQAREYLKTAANTETGKQALRSLGLGFIIVAPDKGDDAASVKVATAVRELLSKQYPTIM